MITNENRECGSCFGLVDENGDTLGDCPVSPPAECDDCGRCLCDGSC